MLAQPVDKNTLSTSQQPVEKTSSRVDPSWKLLYKAGGLTAILYVVLAVAIPTIQVLMNSYFQSSAEYGGFEYLQYISENRSSWLFLQTAVLGTSILAIISFVTLYVALKNIDKNLAALGAVLTVTCQVLFMAYYPVLLGTVYLSDQFVNASTSQQAALGIAADSLIAINNAFNPLYEPLFGLGILFFSIVMLKGVFPKGLGYLGIATCIVAFVGVAMWPVLNVAYLLWWAPFVIWFTAIGWKLYRLGQHE